MKQNHWSFIEESFPFLRQSIIDFLNKYDSKLLFSYINHIKKETEENEI